MQIRIALLLSAMLVSLALANNVTNAVATSPGSSQLPHSVVSNPAQGQTDPSDSDFWPDSAKDWSEFVVAILWLVGLSLAAIKYLVPGPYVPAWSAEDPSCSVRKGADNKFIYLLDMWMVNGTNVICELQSVDLAVKEDPDAEPADWTSLNLHNRRIAPGRRVSIDWHSAHLDALPSGALRVHWTMRYRRRPALGLWVIGWQEETYSGSKTVAVDRDSLDLYG